MSRHLNPPSSPSSFRLLVIADVGGEERRHIGDEAMLEANLAAFRERIPGVTFTVVSRDPAWTAHRYGVDAAALFGFPPGPSGATERAAMLEGLLADATGGNSSSSTIQALAGADGLVLSGGGNLSSRWADLLYERAALLHLARILHKPAVVLGQTLGPRLEGDEQRLLAQTLSSARFVGVRELPSLALALGLGLPPERLWYQCDDALFLQPAPPPADPLPRPGAIAVTIDPQLRASADSLFASLAGQLRRLSQTTGAPLVLIPHAYGRESAALPSDVTEARLLAERIALPGIVVTGPLSAAEVRRITGDASLVVSTRYHPIVFALAAAVPALGIYSDEYCRIKLQGALAHAGHRPWTITYDAVARGELLPTALPLWHRRQDEGRELLSLREVWRGEWQQRWSTIIRALDPSWTPAPPSPSTMFGHPAAELAPSFALALEARRQQWEREQGTLERDQRYIQYLEASLTPYRSLRRWTGAMLRKLGLRH